MTKPNMMWPLPLLIAFIAACSSGNGAPGPSQTPALVQEFVFAEGQQGWEGGFADYPASQESFYQLVSDYRQLPPELQTSAYGLYLSGTNHSDDLYMFEKGFVDGLKPNHAYHVVFQVELATDAPHGCAGVGGAPGEDVRVLTGAATIEPVTSVDPDGYVRMSADKGEDVGDVANSRSCQASRQFELKKLLSGSGVETTTDDTGRLWLLVGTDSGFEGATEIYFTRISASVFDGAP